MPNSFCKQYLELPDESAVAFYEAIAARPDRSEVLRTAPFPVQWIAGDGDAVIQPEVVMEQVALAKRSVVDVYENCGHLSMLEAPQQLVEDLRQFAAYCYKA